VTDHWVLVGLMGVGKTTVDRLLAAVTGRRFVDNDEQLHAFTGRTAREIAERDGLEPLHHFEREALVHALDAREPLVIAGAASVIDDAPTRAVLHERARVIWLDADIDELTRRVRGQAHRPLANDVFAQLDRQEAARDPLYRASADIVVDANQPPDQVVVQLLERINRTTGSDP
jgi:shikimate kinase